MTSNQNTSEIIDEYVERNIEPDKDNIEVYKEMKLFWEDLEDISQELAEHTMKFVTGVLQVIGDNNILNYLGDDVYAFKASSNIFLRDVHNFSIKVKRLREKHENKKGPIDNDKDYELYTKISAEYSDLYSQFMITLTPVMTDIIRIIQTNPAANEYINRKSQPINVEAEVVNNEKGDNNNG
jgi:hypothetical protein